MTTRQFVQVQRRRVHLPPARERDEIVFTRDTDWQRLELLRRTAHLPEDVLMPTRRLSLRVGGYVGLIDTGTVHLELLPRVSPTGDAQSDRHFLMDMLAETGMVPRARESRADIGTSGRRLLEAVIHSAAQRMRQLLAEGVPRRYFSREEAAPTIRGRLDLGRLARRLPSEAHIFPIRHAPLQRDHDLTRLLAALAETLSLETSRPESRRVLAECLRSIGSTWHGALTTTFVESVVLLPQETQWAPFVELARALASGRSPHPVEAGAMSGHGLLFPLSDLFERLLRRRFRLLAGLAELSLDAGGYDHLLREVSTGKAQLQLRPDYVFSDSANRISLVADAKWKILVTDRQSFHVGQEDVYQMAVYLLRHQCHSGLLLYPGAQGLERSTSFEILPRGGRLHVATVDVGGLVSSRESSRSKAEAWLIEVLRAAAEEMNSDVVSS